MNQKVVHIRPGLDPEMRRQLADLQQRCHSNAKMLAMLAYEAEMMDLPLIAAAIDSAYHALLSAAHDIERAK